MKKWALNGMQNSILHCIFSKTTNLFLFSPSMFSRVFLGGEKAKRDVKIEMATVEASRNGFLKEIDNFGTIETSSQFIL